MEQEQTLHNLAFAIMTGSTCGDACWHAREDICHCSCGGVNHGILTRGGTSPVRNSKISGQFYELVSIIPGRQEGECWYDVFKRTESEINRIISDRFPGIDRWEYTSWKPNGIFPVVDRKITISQSKWREVMAVPSAYRLIWSRPIGTEYKKRIEKAA